jgi:hypothetical protein
MTAHTGPSRSALPGAHVPRPLSTIVNGKVHSLTFVRLNGANATWRCSCDAVVTVSARAREDGGERAALERHVRWLMPPLVARDTTARNMTKCPECGSGVSQRRLSKHRAKVHGIPSRGA